MFEPVSLSPPLQLLTGLFPPLPGPFPVQAQLGLQQSQNRVAQPSVPLVGGVHTVPELLDDDEALVDDEVLLVLDEVEVCPLDEEALVLDEDEVEVCPLDEVALVLDEDEVEVCPLDEVAVFPLVEPVGPPLDVGLPLEVVGLDVEDVVPVAAPPAPPVDVSSDVVPAPHDMV